MMLPFLTWLAVILVAFNLAVGVVFGLCSLRDWYRGRRVRRLRQAHETASAVRYFRSLQQIDVDAEWDGILAATKAAERDFRRLRVVPGRREGGAP